MSSLSRTFEPLLGQRLSDAAPRTKGVRPGRRRFSLLRLIVACILALSLSGVAYGAEEIVETAVHLAETGHEAHADEHPGEDFCPGTEHFCFGSSHHCSCCPAAMAALPGVQPLISAAPDHRTLGPTRDDPLPDEISNRIERPPQD